MRDDRHIVGPVCRISVLAGPTFVALLALFEFQQAAADTILVQPDNIGGILGFLILATIFGSLLALPTCLASAVILTWLGDRLFPFRPLSSWMAVAAGLAFGICYFGFGTIEGTAVYAFCGTAMICAALAHPRTGWAS